MNNNNESRGSIRHREKLTCLLAAFIVIGIVAGALAALPDINNPIEPRYFEGSAKEIVSFVKKREKEIAALRTEVQELISKTTSEQDKRVLSEALDFLQALTILDMKLQSQLKTPMGIPVKLPAQGSPPYGLKAFYELFDLLGRVEKELTEYRPKVDLLKRDLESIGDELKSLFSDYIVLRRENPPSPEAYLKLGQIYTQQIRYAISQLQLKRARKIVKDAGKLEDDLMNMLRKTFEHLKITKDDIEDAKAEYEKVSSKMNEQLALLGKSAVNLNKEVVPYEMKLNRVLAKLKVTKRTDSAMAVLLARKQYYEALIEKSQAKLESINQEKLRWKLQSTRAEFRYEWISTYTGEKGGGTVEEFLKKWAVMLDKIRTVEDSLGQQVVDLRTREFGFMRKLTAISDEKASATDPALLRLLASVHRKLKEANSALDSLFVTVSKNRELASDLEREVSLVVGLMRKKAGLVANVGAWSSRSLAKTWENAKKVLYYPLVTIGNTALTLNGIIKVIILLTIGVFLLRKARKKLNEILVKKTQLAPGTIGSVTTLVYYTFLVLVFLIALSTAGINMNQLSIILGGLGVGIGFGLQTIANNFISGLILLIDRSIKVGDFVRLENGLTGQVKNVAIRYAVVRTQDGEDIIVPNSEFVSQRVRNWTYDDNWRRLKIPFGVSYDSDPNEVARLAIEAAREVPTTVEDSNHPIKVRFEGFGDSSLNFFLKVWCRMTELRGDHGYTSDYYFALFRKFKEAGIEIPFPQRDINIRNVAPDILEKLSGHRE